MSREKQREIVSKGGRAAHEKGTAHEWTPDEARAAGRKGGQSSRGGRGRLVRIPAQQDMNQPPGMVRRADGRLAGAASTLPVCRRQFGPADPSYVDAGVIEARARHKIVQ